MKLLLVEDEIHVLKSLEQKILDLNQDYEIIGTASNGTKALELIRGKKRQRICDRDAT